MAMADQMMPKTLPGGGLASFLTSNMDEIDDSILAFGRGQGINSMRDVAERMAQMGRGGDNFVVHASEREMMVPREVVEKNPELRQQIMQGIAAEGADPNAYIVGNEANSINPMTGQREFFLKNLVRGIKNVVKKVAPIVLPVALNFLFPGMGTVAAGAIGSGIGTLVQGGNIQDAFRSALIGGAMGGLYSGVSGAMSGQGFMAGVRQGFTGAPGTGFFELNPSVRNMFGGAGRAPLEATMSSSGAPAAAPTTPAGAAGAEAATAGAERNLLQRARDFVMPQPAATPDALLTEASRLVSQNPGLDMTEALRLVESTQPTSLARFTRPALLAGGAAALAGAFDPVEQEAPPTPGYDVTSQELLARSPQLYSVGVPQAPMRTALSDIAVPTPFSGAGAPIAPINVAPIQLEPIRFAAAGGEMTNFPRRMGAIDGPGTETSDDVPAMLSDGEFVMTARAVRGAGNGDRQQGVRRMYDMMRMFEGGVAR
jgi:hypothetical protein